MTDVQNDLIGDNMVLSNRDKTEHSRDRGQDSKTIEGSRRQQGPWIGETRRYKWITPRRAACATASVRPVASSLPSSDPTWNLAV
jgi:hypothetical protein